MPTLRSIQRTARPDSLFAIRAQEILARGGAEQAIEICREGLVYFPDNPTGYAILAYAYLAIGEHDRARNVLSDGYRRTHAIPLNTIYRQLDQQRITGFDIDAINIEDAVVEYNVDDSGEIIPDDEPEVAASVEEMPESKDNSTDYTPDESSSSRSLALHMGSKATRPRSSNLRLIPGLEFAPLRQEDQLRKQTLASLISESMPDPEVATRRRAASTQANISLMLPSLPGSLDSEIGRGKESNIDGKLPMSLPAITLKQTITELPNSGLRLPLASFQLLPTGASDEPLTPLEELARRLENARIPTVEEADQPRAASFEPAIVSDTLANILVTQGAHAEALKAFQTLARMKPERFDYYQKRILDMKWLLQNPGDAIPDEDGQAEDASSSADDSPSPP